MTLTYNTYVSQLANLMVETSTGSNFTTFLPGCIDYAEQRMYRELDLQTSRIVDQSATLTSDTREFSYPTSVGKYIVVEQINVISPSTADFSTGTRNPLTPVTKEFMDWSWPNASSNTGTPIFFAPLNDTTCIVGPSPDAAYPVEVIGTQRPTPLSSSNTTTFLTLYLPDLFMAASMVFASAYQRDFGSHSDNPAQSASWEDEYQKLKQSANFEELRKRFMSGGWQSMTPSPIATPPRV